jgi:hypothetical protein
MAIMMALPYVIPARLNGASLFGAQ